MSSAGAAPAGMTDLLINENALDYLRMFAVPGRDQEAWRKIDLSNFDPTEFLSPAGQTTLDIAGASKAMRILSLEQALADAVVGPHTHSFLSPSTQHNFFDAFRRAHSTGLRVIHVTGRDPVRIAMKRAISSGRLLSDQTIIVVDAESECTITDRIDIDAPEDAVFSSPETLVITGAASRVNFVNVRRYAGSVHHFHRIHTVQERDSQVHVSVFQVGGLRGKGFVTGTLAGKGATFRGIGLGLGLEAGFNDIEMLVEHLADHTESSLVYKAVLRDRAHSVFDGNLHIPHGIKHVKSRQTNHNILLSKKARAESMPRLVVKSHDVQSDHGATVGELDAEALFFLMARGLNEAEARSLLVEGFVTEIVDEIPAEDMRAEVHELVHAGLA